MPVVGGPLTLTPEQERIVRFGDGPVLVIAGAGTGKTRVIVERVRWLLNTLGSGGRDSLGRLLPDEPAEIASPAGTAQVGLWPAESSGPVSHDPFRGPLVPE